ncbi:hypothetical protein BS78_K040900 [Paspalum vaginatum]|uniref:Uncharacterized protein n=1 Tax=Paspalum vaginatum TaxID=158149 RepID=A0A9W7XF38_9POAL|nr:hypothetical protein BS78_K040900 [Paspalum vaginatum]KAJ1257417.1 hypothetical protein BS78_K040900 [Paspalum vaginatum]KAJ1257418.1 hypothetical protein BS78_K040900 [Paspalum vaginatum]KAJ1257419.1 hypothetical protein BS78_K040900 [Paspalum vaginatum]KAJ1257420.1 hypothetical protein BS78_K040900 [Paspalum vaginatum]
MAPPPPAPAAPRLLPPPLLQHQRPAAPSSMAQPPPLGASEQQQQQAGAQLQLPVDGALHRAPPVSRAMDPVGRRRGSSADRRPGPLPPPLRPMEHEAKRHGVIPARPRHPSCSEAPVPTPAAGLLVLLGHPSISLVLGKCLTKCSNRAAAARHLSVHAQAAASASTKSSVFCLEARGRC